MDGLPELPFEKVLSYLTLQDLFESRAVCRAWRNMIDRFRVKSLCYTQDPIDFYFPKGRLVDGSFAPSLVRSSSFEGFFSTYGQSILSGLKRLRLCALHLHISDIKVFASTLQSFGQLEHLSIIETSFVRDLKNRKPHYEGYTCPRSEPEMPKAFELNMPMLESLHFEELYGLWTVTLVSPRLRSLTVRKCGGNLRLELVHADSIEWLDTQFWSKMNELKNLKYLFQKYCIIPTNHATNEQLLSSLGQLKELHLNDHGDLCDLFNQRQRYGLANLKFYLRGCLVNGPDDPALDAIRYYPLRIDYLADNPSRLADHIPFPTYVRYEQIQDVSSEFAIIFLNRCINLVRMTVYKPVEDIERFLYVIKNSNYIAHLDFADCPEGGQPQELFDRLPEHCAVQGLTIDYKPSNLEFLFKLKHLVSLQIDRYSFSAKTVRKVWEELPFLLEFEFLCANKRVKMELLNVFEIPKCFKLCVDKQEQLVGDLNAVIQFLTNLQ